MSDSGLLPPLTLSYLMYLHSLQAPQQTAHHLHTLTYVKAEKRNFGDSCRNEEESKTIKLCLLGLYLLRLICVAMQFIFYSFDVFLSVMILNNKMHNSHYLISSIKIALILG